MREALHERMASIAAKLALADDDRHTYADARTLAVMATEARDLDTRLAALERVTAAAREAWECPEYPERWRDTLRERLVALDALEETTP